MTTGALLFVGLPGTSLTDGERSILRRLRPGGIVLLPRNIAGADQLADLVRELRSAQPDLILCLDAEGGRVDRLRGIVGPAPAAADLAAAPVGRARRAGRWVGESLRHFGFDLDFAPVVDLDHGRVGNALDRRCLGRAPRSVVARGRAFLEGLRTVGIGGCLKHFPGLGAAGEDTHHLAARIDVRRRLLERDLAPFAALAGEADSLMVAHASYPAWDEQGRPATLSPPIATGLVRHRLGFGGVVFSDDLEMGALASSGPLAERTAAALAAGCDGLLVCHSLAEALEIVGRLKDPGLAARTAAALERLESLRSRLRERRRNLPPPPSMAEIRRRLAGLGSTRSQLHDH